ncbi:MAG: DUF4960 domain-containing protein [Muribaculaceae bacterium]|nr:DUF4960 domain-containing protein [Muribaculaceae bacterium]
MKTSLLYSTALSVSLLFAADAVANPRAAVMIGAQDVESIDNFQEYAAAKYFTESNPDGVVIAPGEVSKINAGNVDCIWLHIDRLNVGMGNLPAEFITPEVIDALKAYVAEGGNLLLTKQATQMLSLLGRIDSKFDPHIYGDGDGGPGTDIWTVNAQIGYWFVNSNDNPEGLDPSQYYDHRGHEMYAGMTTNYDFPMETFALLGTGNGTEMWREDHNCCWDLNSYSYDAAGANTVEKFEKDNNAVVLGTWGHVQDHAVAGIIEFLPQAEGQGTVIANGLAAYEWAPRQGVNAFHDNIEKLTDNTISYLAAKNSGVTAISTDVDDNAPAVYYNLQGIEVSADNLTPGIYVISKGGKIVKSVIR